MTKISTNSFSLNGKSGKAYDFEMYSMTTKFNAVSGIYVFTKRTEKDGKGTHTLIYCGRTEDLSTRFDNHHKMAEIKKNGANCICIHRADARNLEAIETDLLTGNEFICNEVLNS